MGSEAPLGLDLDNDLRTDLSEGSGRVVEGRVGSLHSHSSERSEHVWTGLLVTVCRRDR